MDVLIQQIISGLAAGSVYSLVAVGIVLIYKSTDILNFGHGDMAMFGTFVAFQLLAIWKVPYPIAIILALAFAALLGVAVERVLIRPILGSPEITVVTITFGVGLVLHSVAGWIWQHDPLVFPPMFTGQPLRVLGVGITPVFLGTAVVSLGLMAVLLAFFKLTKQGIAMRAVAQNRTAARLMGIWVTRVFASSWAIGTVLGLVASILIAPLMFLDPNMMAPVLFKALTAATIGGITSLPGAVIGGFALGVLENLLGGYLASEFKDSFAFALIILVLIVKPTGLFGKYSVKKV